MKKLLSVFLAIMMLFSLCSIAVSAAEGDDLVVTVVNDLHYNLTYAAKDGRADGKNDDPVFGHVGSSTRLPNEAIAIVDAFFKDVADNESDFILIPGDLTDAGKADEVAKFVAYLEEIEATTRKKIFVVPGNHDVLTRSKAQFMEDYAAFGYAEALEVDDNSASYVADLNDEYRLIAIDSTTEGNGAHSVYEERLQWIAEQGEKAKADGKKLIGMHHHNFLQHMIMSNLIQPNGVVTAKSENAAETFAKAGIKYVFTGHTHDHDITSYTAEDGTVIYDVVTGSLNGMTSPYRVVTFGDEVKIETRNVTEIDVKLLPKCISEEAKAIASENFPEYQRLATNLSYSIVFNRYTTASGLKGFLKLDNEAVNLLIDKLGNKLNEGLNMPFAKADEAEEGKSIESLLEKYELEIPKTEYKNIIEVAVDIYQGHNLGDEVFPAYCDEVVLATRGIGAVLGYALSDVSGEDYALALSTLVGLTGMDIPVDFFKYAGDGITRMQGIEIVITTVLLPLLVEFANDDAPADNNATLPGYAELVEEKEEATFWEKIFNFFKMLLDAVKTVFTFLPFVN